MGKRRLVDELQKSDVDYNMDTQWIWLSQGLTDTKKYIKRD